MTSVFSLLWYIAARAPVAQLDRAMVSFGKRALGLETAKWMQSNSGKALTC